MANEAALANAAVFKKIQYSQCWEDPLLHQRAFKLKSGANILAIASAGDNVFAHLLDDPGKVIAIDFNESQIALVQLKMAAIRNLDWRECIEFLGEREMSNRWAVFQKIKNDLEPPVKDYWDDNKAFIQKGVIHVGKFESYFHTFQKYVLPLVHSRKTCRKVFDSKSIEEQREFYHKKWNNWRGKLLFKIFFSEFFMSRLARSKEQFANVETKDISKQLLGRSELAFCHLSTEENIFLQYILLSYHPHLDHLPEYLKEENFELIKKRLHRIELKHGTVGEVLKELPPNSVDAFNLSDIFEYLDEPSFEELARQLHQVASQKAVFSYWDFLVPRRLSAQLPELFEYNRELSKKLWMQDRAFVYGDYIVDYSV